VANVGVHSASHPPRPIALGELVELLKHSIDSAVQSCAGLRYDFYEPRDRYAVLLLYRIIDLARAVVVLAEGHASVAIPTVARSALDAYADIANLGDHPRYWENLDAVDASKWKPLLERASRGGNPALRAFSEDKLLPIGRRQFARELKALRASGVEALGVDARFERAGLTNEYESMYTFLSAEVHNNISSLQSRYIDWDEEKAWMTKPGVPSQHRHEFELPCTLTMSEIVLRSTEKVLRLFGHGVAVLSGPNRELERMWQRAQAEENKPPSSSAPPG
jgi:hypothetical protein